jgi:hypothetical protein
LAFPKKLFVERLQGVAKLLKSLNGDYFMKQRYQEVAKLPKSLCNKIKFGGKGMRLYKLFSLAAAILFTAVGMGFLFFPNTVLNFFNNISVCFGLPQAQVNGSGFYTTLASAYMYLVTLLAYQMYRYPEQDIYPSLLAQGKLASSVISIYLFLMHHPYLIYFINFVIDGLIGIAVLYLMKIKKRGFDYASENNAALDA